MNTFTNRYNFTHEPSEQIRISKTLILYYLPVLLFQCVSSVESLFLSPEELDVTSQVVGEVVFQDVSVLYKTKKKRSIFLLFSTITKVSTLYYSPPQANMLKIKHEIGYKHHAGTKCECLNYD